MILEKSFFSGSDFFDALNVAALLHERLIKGSYMSVACGYDIETIIHALIHCPLSISVCGFIYGFMIS